MYNLPDEIIYEIIRYLDYEDYIKFSCLININTKTYQYLLMNHPVFSVIKYYPHKYEIVYRFILNNKYMCTKNICLFINSLYVNELPNSVSIYYFSKCYGEFYTMIYAMIYLKKFYEDVDKSQHKITLLYEIINFISHHDNIKLTKFNLHKIDIIINKIKHKYKIKYN
jgi:hypothetical protein